MLLIRGNHDLTSTINVGIVSNDIQTKGGIMLNQNHKSRNLIASFISLSFFISACGGSSANTTDTSAVVEEAVTETTVMLETEWAPVVRPALKKWKIGYGDGYGGIPFTADVTASINRVAALMGVEIVYCDNAVDQPKTVECANGFITQKVDAVIFANWVGGTEQAIVDLYKAAGIPCLTYDGPHPGCAHFAADQFQAGRLTSLMAAKYVKDAGWPIADIAFIHPYTSGTGVLVDRKLGAIAGIKEGLGLKDSQIDETIEFSIADDVQAKVTDWVTAHPEAKYVICIATNGDATAIACMVALEKAGYTLANAAVFGQGASDEALVELRTRTDKDSIFKGTLAYFPTLYGDFMVPAIVDVLEGKKIPDFIVNKSIVEINRANLEKYFPAK